MTKKIKRVLLKISWEALAWEKWYWLDANMLNYVSELVSEIHSKWLELWIVIWWWNIFRWLSEEWNNLDRVSWDQMGILATIINWLAMVDFLAKKNVKSKLMTSVEVSGIWIKFDKKTAIKHIENWNVIICVGGTWNPYFTTDTAWVLRALELECDYIVKATKVDWVYDKDPKKFENAVKFKSITYDEILEKNLRIMDLTAISLARENNLPLIITNLYKKESIINSISWKTSWTIISK